jgi:hypothetical protein
LYGGTQLFLVAGLRCIVWVKVQDELTGCAVYALLFSAGICCWYVPCWHCNHVHVQQVAQCFLFETTLHNTVGREGRALLTKAGVQQPLCSEAVAVLCMSGLAGMAVAAAAAAASAP